MKFRRKKPYQLIIIRGVRIYLFNNKLGKRKHIIFRHPKSKKILAIINCRENNMVEDFIRHSKKYLLDMIDNLQESKPEDIGNKEYIIVTNFYNRIKDQFYNDIF